VFGLFNNENIGDGYFLIKPYFGQQVEPGLNLVTFFLKFNHGSERTLLVKDNDNKLGFSIDKFYHQIWNYSSRAHRFGNSSRLQSMRLSEGGQDQGEGSIIYWIDYTPNFKSWKCTFIDIDLIDNTQTLRYRIWIYDQGRTTLSL
jgi:hypothetical protein